MPCERLNPLKFPGALRESPKWVIWNSREDVDERQGFVVIFVEYFFRSGKRGCFLSLRNPNGFLLHFTGRGESCAPFSLVCIS